MSGMWEGPLMAQHLTATHATVTEVTMKAEGVVTDCTWTIFSPPDLFDDLTKKTLWDCQNK